MVKYCAVPECKNSTSKTPNKLFVTVPKDIQKRQKWLKLARRCPDEQPNTMIFFCEDHFNMETDMTNYCQYKMGFSKLILMKKDALPSKFDCQQLRSKRRRVTSHRVRLALKKRLRQSLIQECEQQLCKETRGAAIPKPNEIPKANITILKITESAEPDSHCGQLAGTIKTEPDSEAPTFQYEVTVNRIKSELDEVRERIQHEAEHVLYEDHQVKEEVMVEATEMQLPKPGD